MTRSDPTALLALARKLALPAAFKATQGEIQSLAADYVAQATRIEALEAVLIEACGWLRGVEAEVLTFEQRVRLADIKAVAEGKP